MNPNASAAKLVAVAHDVVLLRPDPPRFGFKKLEVLVQRRGELVVLCLPDVALLIPLERRHLGHPGDGEHVRVEKAKASAELQAKLAKSGHRRLGGIRDDEN